MLFRFTLLLKLEREGRHKSYSVSSNVKKSQFFYVRISKKATAKAIFTAHFALILLRYVYAQGV